MKLLIFRLLPLVLMVGLIVVSVPVPIYGVVGSVSKTNVQIGTLVPAPSDLTVRRTTNDLSIAWQDHSGGKATFKVERKIENGAYQELATVAAGKFTYEDKVEAEKVYYYRVRAFIGTGNNMRFSAYSNEVMLNTKSATKPVASIPKINPVLINPKTTPTQSTTPTQPTVLTIPVVINPQTTLTVTGSNNVQTPTAVLTIPAVIDAGTTLTVTGSNNVQTPTAVLTIPTVINPVTTLTVTGNTP